MSDTAPGSGEAFNPGVAADEAPPEDPRVTLTRLTSTVDKARADARAAHERADRGDAEVADATAQAKAKADEARRVAEAADQAVADAEAALAAHQRS
jgi:hypothetical protein